MMSSVAGLQPWVVDALAQEEAIEPEEPSPEPFPDADTTNKEFDADGETIAEGKGEQQETKSGSLVSEHKIDGVMHNVLKVTGKLTILNTDQTGNKESLTNLCWVRIHFNEHSFWDVFFWVTFKDSPNVVGEKECTGPSPDGKRQIHVTLQPGGQITGEIQRVFEK